MTRTGTPADTTMPARDHERHLAGAAMRGSDEAAEIQSLLRVEDFADYPARIVVQAAFDLMLAGREPSPEAVSLLLRTTNKFDDLGYDPDGVLRGLLDGAPNGKNIRFAAEQVREWSVRRQVRIFGTAIASEAANPSGSTEELVATAERGLQGISESSTADQPTHIGAALRNAFSRYENPEQSAIVPTGLPELDEFLAGGFRPGELVLLGARPGVGKSSVSLGIAAATARSGTAAMFFSLEMSEGELTDRLVSAESSVPLARLRSRQRLGPAEAERVRRRTEGGGLDRLPIWFDYRPRLTVNQIAATVRRHVRRHGVKLVVVDYLQLIAPEDRKTPRHEQVGAISRGLKLLAKDAGVTILAAAQLNREVNAKEEPKLSHLRESGSLEQDADVVLLPHVTEPDNLRATWDVDLILAKQRNGPSGVKVGLELHRAYARFESRIPM